MKKIGLFFSLVILLLSSINLHGQNFTKYINKIEANYESGAYVKSQKFVKKAKKKVKKKLGEKSTVMASLLIWEAKVNHGLGLLTAVEDPLNKALTINEEINSENAASKAEIQLFAADVFESFGHFRRAGIQFSSAKEYYLNSDQFEQIQDQLSVLEAKILIGKGFYKDALPLIKSSLEAMPPAIDKSPLKIKRNYALLLILNGNALRLMGDYTRSDSSFISTARWIESKIGKNDVLLGWTKYLNALQLRENGLELEPQEKLYREAYALAVRKALPTHLFAMEIQKGLLEVLHASESKKLAGMITEQQKIAKTFPNGSIYKLYPEITEAMNEIQTEEFRDGETKLRLVIKSEEIPAFHLLREDLLTKLSRAALLQKRKSAAESYFQEIIKSRTELAGEKTPTTYLAQLKLANFYIDYSDKISEVSEIYLNGFLNNVKPQITDGHVDYPEILSHLALFYESTDKYDLASQSLNEALQAARKKYDNKDIEYGRILSKIASLQITMGDFAKAEKNLEEANKIFKDWDTGESKSYLSILYINQARIEVVKGEFDEAEDLLVRSEEIKEKATITLDGNLSNNQEDLVDIYFNVGKLANAEALIREIFIAKTKEYGKESRQLIRVNVANGRLKLTQGDYASAEKFANEGLKIGQSIFGENSSKTVPPQLLIADIYRTIGDYDKAINLYDRCIKILENQFGKDYLEIGKIYMAMGQARFFRNDPVSQIASNFNESERIITTYLGKNSPTYADLLREMAVVQISQKNYALAFDFLNRSNTIWAKKVSKRNNIKSASIDELKADIHYQQREFKKAEDLYEDAKKKFVKFFNDKHPNYIKVQAKLAKTYFMQQDFKHSLDQMDNVLATHREFIVKYFPSLSEREKAKFWNTIKGDYEFYNSLIINKSRNEKYIGELYNNALTTKALLLSSSIKVRQRIMNSGDPRLIETYENWLNKKELLTDALSMSAEQLTANGLNTSKLAQEVESLEKILSQQSEAFGTNAERKAVTWENIRGSLKENEVAIEIVRFREFDLTFTDNVKYGVIYVTGDKKSKPKLILLENGNELENKNLKGYRNSIKFKIKDNQSYDAYWAPIITEIGSLATIYISPDGVYNQINIEAIPDKLNPGKYVLDNSNIVLVSNTKELYLNKINPPKISDNQIAFMVGNPKFYLNSAPGVPKPYSGLSRETAEVISELPGTKAEIEELNGFLNRKGWQVEQYMYGEAEELTVKSMESPKIFHIATHGFFQSKGLQASALDAELNESYLYDNPLLKSGLLLKGAGDILNETKYNYNISDGILTAYEAMNLNLDKTDLVVLSACETGLGEIEAGEGVYGLQRSFLVAGAKAVVMSLFKVSDEATQQLMVSFYKKWFATGDKRQAFIDAKKEIRNEFRDPIYWGPFVMVGLN